MAGNRVTVTASHTIHVDRTPEAVFDYTQDYRTRSIWDGTVKEAEVISEEPRVVKLLLSGIGSATLRYQLFRRGERTSAAFEADRSRLFLGGGGSWSYLPGDGGTDWTQTNTLELKGGLLARLVAPILRRNMATLTRKSMAKAKEIMEAAAPTAPIGG